MASAAYMREYYARNPAQYVKHLERKRRRYDPARRRAQRAAHIEVSRAWERARYAANRDRERARADAWQREHPERAQVRQSRRRARLAGATGSHTAEEWLIRLAEFHGRCAYCGSTDRIERDHVVPITRGGSDSIDNIVPACKSCNAGKHNKLLADWRGPASAQAQARAA